MSLYTNVKNVTLLHADLFTEDFDGQRHPFGEIRVEVDYGVELADDATTVLSRNIAAVHLVRFGLDEDGDRRSQSIRFDLEDLDILAEVLAGAKAALGVSA